MRQTVLGLTDRPKAAAARSAKSEVDRRLSGNLVWLTASQATALTTARSRGGKSGLATSASLIGQGEVTACPAVSPEPHRIRMQLDRSCSCNVRDRRAFMEEQNKPSPLVLAVAHGSPTDKAPALIKELGGERGLALGHGARHGATPFAVSIPFSGRKLGK